MRVTNGLFITLMAVAALNLSPSEITVVGYA